ncbi:ABC transporter ATP-binding protein [Kitasatospora mediocidica]|uniref:ABC transporter ATP-binding protein n=1 Tax=Kitasatospora mediocidica TaxID=58352 RepID=UPI00055E6FF7|nr:ABC transporter ATP-binding protein [Kitasatospora mediocidica]
MIELRAGVEVFGLGKRYRRGWALRNCSFRLPAGRICALVGPNGAGKSTLLSVLAGLLVPTEGSVELLGMPLGDRESVGRVAFVAQDKPLYTGFTVAELLRLGEELNPRWDRDKAELVVAGGGFPRSARIGSLSGGQRTRVSLALALGKRPDLLILDEPMSDLDPLARHQLMGLLMAEAAERGTTVLMSSHVVSELQEVCDYLVLVADGAVRMAGDVEEILGAHRLLVGDQRDEPHLAGHQLVESRLAGRTLSALVRPLGPLRGDWQSSTPTLEELLLAHLRSPQAPALLTVDARVTPRAVAA